ncbi:MAG TPA: outer membrane lipoprotein carrier protein LolA [Labilithrix sp.]|nr:outer membrane lipoprotein carrier protein LolA [Labilithrix sp.]
MFLFAFALGVAASDVPGAHADARPDGLGVLLERCAASPGLTAKFVEEKQIALLSVPLRSEGTLHFSPARGLVRHTSKPSPQSVLVTDKDLDFWDGKATKKVALGSSATLATFARAFSNLLTANRAALEKTFTLAFHPHDAGDAWDLVLTPTEPDLKKMLSSIEIEGTGLELSLLRIREANGDVSTTRFSSVDPAKRYTDAELDRLFRVPPG